MLSLLAQTPEQAAKLTEFYNSIWNFALKAVPFRDSTRPQVDASRVKIDFTLFKGAHRELVHALFRWGALQVGFKIQSFPEDYYKAREPVPFLRFGEDYLKWPVLGPEAPAGPPEYRVDRYGLLIDPNRSPDLIHHTPQQREKMQEYWKMILHQVDLCWKIP